MMPTSRLYNKNMRRKLAIPAILSVVLCCALLPLYGAEEIDLNELLKGGKIISPSASYETGQAEITPQFAAFLTKLGAFLKENAGLVIEIGGHTDNSGSPALNQKLSLSRAQRVKDYLVRNSGINEERIQAKGYAANSPIADNKTPQGKAQNRRTEIMALQNTDPAGKLTYIRREVFTKSPDKIDFSRATLNQDLFHLYRVLTRDKSNANVTFQDLSKINLGPQSLMIMYSLLERGIQLPRKQNIQLLTGGLRTKLNQLKGGLQVETPSALINADSVEILVGIDEKKMSALSVFDGKSEIKAQGKSVSVPEGYGTIVNMGEPPAPPQPLPAAPQLIEPIEAEINLPSAADADKTAVRFRWRRIEDRYHLQVAADAQFSEIIEDQVFQDDNATLSLGRGIYYWRAAAIDKLGIEGYSAQSFFTIAVRKAELPLEIVPLPRYVVDTVHRIVTVSGKTVPDAQITVKEQPFLVDQEGRFSGRISLIRGWNQIRVRVVHPAYKEKIVYLSYYRRASCAPAVGFGLRYDYAPDSDTLADNYTYQAGITFCLDSRFEGEFSLGLATLKWKTYPGDYLKEATAIPFTAALRLVLSSGKIKPFLSTAFTVYLAFPEKRITKTRENELFISPGFGGGITFPLFDSPVRFEIMYAPFLRKEPFFPELMQRIALILKIMINL